MRISLNKKDFAYYTRVKDLQDDSRNGLLLRLNTSGPMTRRIVLAELARREGAKVVLAR